MKPPLTLDQWLWAMKNDVSEQLILVGLIRGLQAENNERARQLLQVHDALHRECSGPVDLAAEIRQLRAAHEAATHRVSKLEERIREIDAAAKWTDLSKWNAPLQRLECAIDEAVDLVNGFESPEPEPPPKVHQDLELGSGAPGARLDLGLKHRLIATPTGSAAMEED